MSVSATINIDRYCSGCDSDQHTVDEPPSGFSTGSPLWCNLCWDWQKPLSQQVKRRYQAVPIGTAERL